MHGKGKLEDGTEDGSVVWGGKKTREGWMGEGVRKGGKVSGGDEKEGRERAGGP